MPTSGASVFTRGRAPRRERSLSATASFERRATNCVFLSWSFVPRASMAMVAPGATWSSQGMAERPS